MMPTLRTVSLSATIVAAGGLFAQSAAAQADAYAATQLARNNGCFRCHATQNELKEGPAWTNIAARRRGNPGAQAELMAYLTSSGNQAMFLDGQVIYHKMIQTNPPNDLAQARNLVDWILSQ
jgi:cytochrome c